MYDELIEITGIPQDGTILEIGSGTGQATLPLAKRGYTITCLEPGLKLMQIAKKKLTKYPKVNFLNTTFEEWPVETYKYDLIISATAFHWVDQKVGYKKAYLSLKPNGNLALFWNKHPKPYTGFFEEVQQIYQKIVPEWPDPNDTQSDEDWIKETQVRIVESGLFDIIKIKTYYWLRNYSSNDYIKLLSTYSDHIGLEEKKRKQLFDEIKNFIEDRFNGIVKRPYLTVLFIALKIS